MMKKNNLSKILLACGAAWICALASLPVHAVTINWSPVGNPDNAADPATGSRFGAVGYAYNIGTYDVTNSQYVEFLNAKDSTGANALRLYNGNMSNATVGGINFNAGNANGSKYTLISGRQNHPANSTTWYDGIRFANWLNNGQENGDAVELLSSFRFFFSPFVAFEPDNVGFRVASVPEPSSLLLTVLAACGLPLLLKRRARGGSPRKRRQDRHCSRGELQIR
jgi:hypothetical protein